MKFAILLILLKGSQLFAITCADFSGKYMDEENVRIEIKQNGCQHISFISLDKVTDLVLDGKSRQHEIGQKQISFVSAFMTKEELVIEQLIQNKSSMGSKYIYKMILTYKFKDPETLLEDSKLYNHLNKLIDYKSIELFKIKTAN